MGLTEAVILKTLLGIEKSQDMSFYHHVFDKSGKLLNQGLPINVWTVFMRYIPIEKFKEKPKKILNGITYITGPNYTIDDLFTILDELKTKQQILWNGDHQSLPESLNHFVKRHKKGFFKHYKEQILNSYDKKTTKKVRLGTKKRKRRIKVDE